MKRISISLLLLGVITISGIIWQSSVRAQNIPMTEAHIERIRDNCIDAQSTLRQLHASDALLRVNRGQLYESISTKLMAPLNSRITLNRLDGVNLVSIATTYESQLNYFRQSYKQYEEAMSQTLKINCMNQPVVFYDSVADTRAKRKKVHDSTLALHNTIREYKSSFELFSKQYEGADE
jgi:hypothetical protein